MQRSDEFILTTHTGSLPRPASLLALYDRRVRDGAVEESVLEAAGREAVARAVKAQVAAGIHVGNDGEQRREGFFLYAQRRMTGFGGSWKRWPRQDVERYPMFKAMAEARAAGRDGVTSLVPPCVVGEVRYRDPLAAEDEPRALAGMIASGVAGFREGFMTAPSPGIIASACQNRHYPDERAYLAALAQALRVEYEAVVRHGLVLQLDCPDLALEHHRSYQDRPLADFLGFVERVVEAINGALVNVPRDRVRMHVCWGNYEGPHDCDVDLATIWPILRQMKVGGFVLPFANGRHAHEFRVLAEHPLVDDQIVVAGVIDTLTNFVEHPETVADRIERVARAVGDPARVLAGTDCGFDSTAGQGRVAEDVAWAKLRALAEGARIASRRLFGRDGG